MEVAQDRCFWSRVERPISGTRHLWADMMTMNHRELTASTTIDGNRIGWRHALTVQSNAMAGTSPQN